MLSHPTIIDVSRSFRILSTLPTKNRSLDEMKFAINTIVNSSKYMHDILHGIAAEVEKSAQEGRKRECDLAASNARKEMRIERLRQIVQAKRAAQGVFEQDIQRMWKPNGGVEKKKPSRMTVFRKAKFTGKKEVKWKPLIGGAGDVVPEAAEIGSG